MAQIGIAAHQHGVKHAVIKLDVTLLGNEGDQPGQFGTLVVSEFSAEKLDLTFLWTQKSQQA
jgi:hypothetical protein